MLKSLVLIIDGSGLMKYSNRVQITRYNVKFLQQQRLTEKNELVEEAMIRNRFNRFPHPAQDTKW